MIKHLSLWDAVKLQEAQLTKAVHESVVSGIQSLGSDIKNMEWANIKVSHELDCESDLLAA